MNPWRAALTSATASGNSTRIASRSAIACSSTPPCGCDLRERGRRELDGGVERQRRELLALRLLDALRLLLGELAQPAHDLLGIATESKASAFHSFRVPTRLWKVVRRSALAVLLLGVAACVAAIGVTVSAGGTSHAAARAFCPKTPRLGYAPIGSAARILQAAQRQIPRAFRGKWVNSEGVVKLTRSAYQVTDVVELGEPPNIGNAEATPLLGNERLSRYAARRCGTQVADESWAVVFDVPASQAAAYGTGIAFIAPVAHRRWKLWYALVV